MWKPSGMQTSHCKQKAAAMPFCCLLWCSGTWVSLQRTDQPKHFGRSENSILKKLVLHCAMRAAPVQSDHVASTLYLRYTLVPLSRSNPPRYCRGMTKSPSIPRAV